MAGQVKLSGSLIAGPPAATSVGFPASSFTSPIALKENPRPYNRATGILCRSIVTVPAVFEALGEPGNAVAQAVVLYLKTDGPILLRETVDDGAGGTVVYVTPIDGLLIHEYPTDRPLEFLEVDTQGQTVTVEYFLVGDA
jgi:hypothetical protein